jgi:D-serine deaminase-like pyridoxal phosphate-dependent protein
MGAAPRGTNRRTDADPAASIGTPTAALLPDVRTPVLVVDESILETNLRAMADLAREAEVDLRPHWKTHKCPELARRQLELGAVGGTVATAEEAEIFLAAGFEDLLIATPIVDSHGIERLLARRGAAALTVLVESEEGARRWSDAAARAGTTVPVILEIDVGMGRTGVSPGEGALPLARTIADDERLELAGVMTHAGHAYGASSPREIASIGRAEGETLVRTAGAIRAAGIGCRTVSVGSTPTVPHSARVPGVTEIRPGNYAFHDAIQVGLGVAPEERCALTVLATVIARPVPDRVVLDCGSKALSSDAGVGRGVVEGFGRILGHPDLVIRRLSEEHGILAVPPSMPLALGDRVRILPNHACVVVNLHERMVRIRDGAPAGEWRVAARRGASGAHDRRATRAAPPGAAAERAGP